MKRYNIVYFTNIFYSEKKCIVTYISDKYPDRIEISLDVEKRTNPFYVNISQLKSTVTY